MGADSLNHKGVIREESWPSHWESQILGVSTGCPATSRRRWHLPFAMVGCCASWTGRPRWIRLLARRSTGARPSRDGGRGRRHDRPDSANACRSGSRIATATGRRCGIRGWEPWSLRSPVASGQLLPLLLEPRRRSERALLSVVPAGVCRRRLHPARGRPHPDTRMLWHLQEPGFAYLCRAGHRS